MSPRLLAVIALADPESEGESVLVMLHIFGASSGGRCRRDARRYRN